MNNVLIAQATSADAAALIDRMNPFQAKLILALGDKTIEECIERAFGGSTAIWAGRVDGELAAIWGVYPLEGGCGYPWLYSTAAIAKAPRRALLIGFDAVTQMNAIYPRLFGIVDSRFEASVNFAKHLGFTIGGYKMDPPFVSIERWRQ
jgi:hypothetical protein